MTARDPNPAILSPEEEECLVKQAELAELQSQLADAELDLATLRAELKVFEEEYLRVVGPCLAEMESNPGVRERPKGRRLRFGKLRDHGEAGVVLPARRDEVAIP